MYGELLNDMLLYTFNAESNSERIFFGKSAIISWSYGQDYGGTLFELTV